jgi:hypothetical protein
MRDQFYQTHAQITELFNQNQRQVQELEQRAHIALGELTVAILPTLSAESLNLAVQLTGYVTVAQGDPLSAMERNRQDLLRRIAEIEADRSYRDRLLLRAPRVGLLTREIAELEEFRAPLAEFLDRCLHPRLEHLLETGYGTANYNVGFWRMSYYSDWRAASRICERVGKDKTFAEVRSELLAARETVQVYDTKLAKLREEVQKGEALEHEHDESLRLIPQLPEIYLTRVRDQMANYLRDVDLVVIGDRLQQEPNVDALAKRYVGLRKQAAYLRDSGQHLLQNTAAPVAQTIQSLDRDIMKYQRPKAANSMIAGERYAKLRSLQQRNAKCRQNADRYRQTSTVIYSFDDYHRGRLDDDFLWWDCMAHSYAHHHADAPKAYGYFIPEVAQFHSAHPDYHYHAAADTAADLEAAAAVASVDDAVDSFTSSDIS